MKIRHKAGFPKCKILGFLPVKILSALLVAVIFAACASAPAEPPPPATEAQTAAQDALGRMDDAAALDAAAKDRADKARQMGVDFQAAGYFQSEWDQAEALYNQGKYNDAAPLYEAVAAKAAAQFAEDQGNELLKARERVVAAGGEEYAEDFLLKADNQAAEASKLLDAKDYYAAKDATSLAQNMYEAMETGLNALNLRIELEDWGFVGYDPEKIEAIDEQGLSAIDDYEAGNIATARRKAEEVLEKYTDYRAEWMDVYAADVRDSAAQARQHALDVKANIADRYDYDAADSIYGKAQEAYDQGDFETAANSYHRSYTMFKTLSENTELKRLIAEEAIRQAEIKMAESDETAQRAEIILEGGLQ